MARDWISRPVTGAADGTILFDGFCLFCSRWVRFVIKRDPAIKFRFLVLQSKQGRALAKELDIDTEQNRRTAPFQTANGVIQAPLVSLESITVGGMEIRNLTAAVHDVLADSRVAGLLGLNFLSNFRMDIDTQKGVLHLEKK